MAKRETDFAVVEDLADGKFDEDSPFGFHAYDLGSDVHIMEKLGIKWLRHGGGWDERKGNSWFKIEEKKGKYDWSVLDRTVELCEKHHMKLLLVMTGVPEWVSSATKEQLGKKSKEQLDLLR